MFGIGVAEQLDKAGLLVREHHDPLYAKSGIVQDIPSHWMVRCEYDGVTSLAQKNGMYLYMPHPLDTSIKQWVRNLQTPKIKRRFEMVWLNKTTADRNASMLHNYGRNLGITATLVPVKYVEV